MHGANPAVIGLRRVGPEVDGKLRLDPQQIAPLHRPVVGKLLPLQQAVDQGAAFVRVRSARNSLGLLGGGQRADDVEIDPADKHRVGAQSGRLDAQLLQPVEDQLVDLAVGVQLGVALVGRPLAHSGHAGWPGSDRRRARGELDALGQHRLPAGRGATTAAGSAGVPRATLVVLMATASSFQIPATAVLMLLGVDTLMDMGRTAMNVIGNCLAAAVVARWEGELKPAA